MIAFALLNLFHEPILSDTTHENVASAMIARLNVPNRLENLVDQYNLSQVRASFIDLQYTPIDNVENNSLLQFPVLTMEDLFNISLGTYQIDNATSYYAQHQKEEVFLVKKFEGNSQSRISSIDFSRHGIVATDPVLVRAYMKSRFRGGKCHHIFFLLIKQRLDVNLLQNISVPVRAVPERLDVAVTS